jgi:hypothetical protein
MMAGEKKGKKPEQEKRERGGEGKVPQPVSHLLFGLHIQQ